MTKQRGTPFSSFVIRHSTLERSDSSFVISARDRVTTRRSEWIVVDPVNAQIDRVLRDVVALRHDLHAHPELGFEVERTADRVAEVLGSLDGFDVRTGVGKTGVVATLNRKSSGPTVALRADMDALPIEEKTGCHYASTVPGRMHACGHDGHTSCLLGAAMVLSRRVGDLSGPVRFIFQPAEETDGGGRYMCEQGALDDPAASVVFALHGWPELPVGAVGLRSGPAMAASNPFSVRIHGAGGHAATPHRTIDPIVTAARIIDGLQTVVSRSTRPDDPVVVTVGQLHAGSAANVIPDEAWMEGTIRTVQAETRERVVGLVRRIIEHTAQAHGATAEVNIIEGYPALVNDPGLADFAVGVARDSFGHENVSTGLAISMGTEDFAYYAQRVPAVMIRLGLRPTDAKTCPALHTPHFDFNDEALPIGIRLFVALVLQIRTHNAAFQR